MDSVQVDISGLSVFIAMPCYSGVSPQTTASLVGATTRLARSGTDFELELCANCSLVEMARTKLARNFLKSNKDYLFWIDSDVSFDPADFARVLALSSKIGVVGAVYPAKTDNKTFLIKRFENGLGAGRFGTYVAGGCGMGFSVAPREAIQALAKESPLLMFPGEQKPLPHMFYCDHDAEAFRGEDVNYFCDLYRLGWPLHIDPTIELGHVGVKEYRGALADVLPKATGGRRSDNEEPVHDEPRLL